MTDERFYCLTHRIPVEYIPELDLYTCGRCENTFLRDEVLPGHLIEESVETILRRLENEKGVRS